MVIIVTVRRIKEMLILLFISVEIDGKKGRKKLSVLNITQPNFKCVKYHLAVRMHKC